MLSIRSVTLSAIAALLMGAAGALAAGGDGSPARPAVAPPGEQPAQAVPATLTAAFGLLRQAAARPDSATYVSTVFGTNRALTRQVATPAGAVRVIPGRSGVCLEIDDPIDGSAGSCASIDDALNGGLMLSLVADARSDSRVVVGLVPDGVGAVSLDGVKITPADNVWVARTSTPEHVGSYTDASGAHAIRVP